MLTFSADHLAVHGFQEEVCLSIQDVIIKVTHGFIDQIYLGEERLGRVDFSRNMH